MVDIAQLARAPDCGSGGRRFETDYPPHTKRRIINRLLFVVRLTFLLWDVAKRLRQRTLTPSPAGSNPAIPASVTLDPVYLWVQRYFSPFSPYRNFILFVSCLQSRAFTRKRTVETLLSEFNFLDFMMRLG